MPREDLRKLVHIGFSLGAFLTPWIGGAGGLALACLGLAHNVLVMPRYAFGRSLYRPIPGGGRVGIISYPLMVALLFVCVPAYVAAATWVVIGFGDGLAAIVGRRACARLPWNPGKTWRGSFAFAAAATLAAALVLSLCLPQVGSGRLLALAVCGSVAGAAVESLPWRVDDNLSVAAVVAPVLWGLSPVLGVRS